MLKGSLLTVNYEGNIGFMVLRVRPTPTRLPFTLPRWTKHSYILYQVSVVVCGWTATIDGRKYRVQETFQLIFFTVRAFAEDGKGMFKKHTSNPFQGEIGEVVRFFVSLGLTTGKC